MGKIHYHAADVLAPLDKPGEFRAIADRYGSHLHVVGGDGKLHYERFPRTKNPRMLGKFCEENEKLATLAGLAKPPALHPMEVTVAFRDLRALAALVVTERNPKPLTPRDVQLRLLWGDQTFVLDPDLAQRYAKSELTAQQVLENQAKYRDWPEPSTEIVSHLGALGDLRTLQLPSRGGARPTPAQVQALRPIEGDLDHLLKLLAAQRQAETDWIPSRDQVIEDWTETPRSFEGELDRWRRGMRYENSVRPKPATASPGGPATRRPIQEWAQRAWTTITRGGKARR